MKCVIELLVDCSTNLLNMILTYAFASITFAVTALLVLILLLPRGGEEVIESVCESSCSKFIMGYNVIET